MPDYPYFQKCYQSISIDLSKQQKLVDDPKAIQHINTGSVDRAEGAIMLFIIEEAKFLKDFSNGTVIILWFYFVLI